MDDIKIIANKIKNAGGRLYLVGGAVRDELMGITKHDEDYCVTRIDSNDFEKLFPNAVSRGKFFPVYDLDGKEFAMARKDIKTGIGHKNFVFEVNKNISIEEDLERRDITINSIAKDVLDNTIIDPFNGIKDLESKIIRATSSHFVEDPLRVYRVARFASIFGFDVDSTTLNMMNSLRNELNSLSPERVFIEFRKALLSSKPSIFFNILRKCNLLDVHFKEIYDLINVEQPVKYHPEGDAYNHTMLVLDMSADLTANFEEFRKLQIRFSALVHDLGKGLTPKSMYPHHYGHEINGLKLVKSLCNSLKVPESWKKCGETACKFHMKGGIFAKMRPSKQIDFIEQINKTPLGLDGMKIVVICDKTSSNKNYNISEINFDIIGEKCLNIINGDYIKEKYGLSSGLELKKKLHDERVSWLVKEYKKAL